LSIAPAKRLRLIFFSHPSPPADKARNLSSESTDTAPDALAQLFSFSTDELLSLLTKGPCLAGTLPRPSTWNNKTSF
jgi:hypothetical protein